MRIRDLWVTGSLTVLLGLGACSDATEPQRSNTTPNTPLYSSVADVDPDPDAPPLGIESLFSDQSEQALRTLIDGEFQSIFNKGAYSKAQKAFDSRTPRSFSQG